ncbi:uncharacterized protein [Struthio camelus]|uniref:uncharacterized protein n=1 Tax=Struthio camelus TaxID=8801 RepID=UPI003603BB6E
MRNLICLGIWLIWIRKEGYEIFNLQWYQGVLIAALIAVEELFYDLWHVEEMFYALFAIKHLIHSSLRREERFTDGSRWSFSVLCSYISIRVEGWQQQRVFKHPFGKPNFQPQPVLRASLTGADCKMIAPRFSYRALLAQGRRISPSALSTYQQPNAYYRAIFLKQSSFQEASRELSGTSLRQRTMLLNLKICPCLLMDLKGDEGMHPLLFLGQVILRAPRVSPWASRMRAESHKLKTHSLS